MEKQSPEELEFTKGEVTWLDGSHAFISIKTDTNMGFSDHRHVVGAITDCKSYDLRIVLLNKPNNIGFLARRDPAANDGLTSLRDLKELLFVQIVV